MKYFDEKKKKKKRKKKKKKEKKKIKQKILKNTDGNILEIEREKDV